MYTYIHRNTPYYDSTLYVVNVFLCCSDVCLVIVLMAYPYIINFIYTVFRMRSWVINEDKEYINMFILLCMLIKHRFGRHLGFFWLLFGWLWGPSGDFWGVSGGLLGTPGGLGERLGSIFGTKCPKKTSQIPERAAQVLPKGGQGSPRGPQMATKSAPRDH